MIIIHALNDRHGALRGGDKVSLVNSCDVAIIGGGIVGLAAAYECSRRFPRRRVVVLEKEDELAAHQTGRNSGVMHSGIYYAPGSLKARNCRRGKALLEAFCAEHELPFELCGKVVVAVDERELPQLDKIRERAVANGVACELVDARGLRDLEPHAAGVRALHVPETGIVDYVAVCAKLAELVRVKRGDVITDARVTRIDARANEVVVHSNQGELVADLAINCAGLHSDRVVQMSGARRPARIVPFRGEYYELTPDARELCRNLIYPVPDPSFPFLGVHFTRMIGGAVECGPNAVLALAREGYTWSDVDLGDVLDVVSYAGFWRLVGKYGRTGLGEVRRSLSKRAFVRALRRLVPEIQARHLQRAPAGVRAQALSASGSLVDDFLIQRSGRVVHVCNAPSPAATSALAIGETLVDSVAEELR
jgi:L-2-hydroxyglutarate oxidase